MKAVLFHQHGGPEALIFTDFPIPESGPGEVLVCLEGGERPGKITLSMGIR